MGSKGRRSSSPLTLWQNAIWASKLRGNEKIVALALGTFLDTNTLRATPSLDTLKNLAGVARGTVQTALKALRGEGLLDWETGARRPGGRQQPNQYQGLVPTMRGQSIASGRGQNRAIQRPVVSKELIEDPKGSSKYELIQRTTHTLLAPNPIRQVEPLRPVRGLAASYRRTTL